MQNMKKKFFDRVEHVEAPTIYIQPKQRQKILPCQHKIFEKCNHMNFINDFLE